MRTPLHLDQNDHSADANLARIALYQHNYRLTGGKGFRQPSTKKGGAPTRIERLGAASFA